MFFPLAKLTWFLIAPSHLLLWLVLAAALARMLRRPAAMRILSWFAALLFVCAGVLPLWVWPARALEDRYPRPGWPAHVDGILVLGGGLNTPMLLARGVPAPERSETRVLAGAEAAHRYPRARLVFSGGGSDPALAESVTAAYILAQAGVDRRQVVLENRARDTYENILFSRRLVHPRPGETWLLVTSALHMPRAMAAAEAQGWRMIPWPSDYLTVPGPAAFRVRPFAALEATDAVCHEWLGLLAYRFRAQPARR